MPCSWVGDQSCCLLKDFLPSLPTQSWQLLCSFTAVLYSRRGAVGYGHLAGQPLTITSSSLYVRARTSPPQLPPTPLNNRGPVHLSPCCTYAVGPWTWYQICTLLQMSLGTDEHRVTRLEPPIVYYMSPQNPANDSTTICPYTVPEIPRPSLVCSTA